MQIYEKNVALIKLTKINMPKSAIPYYCCKSLKMLYIKYTYIFDESRNIGLISTAYLTLQVKLLYIAKEISCTTILTFKIC